MEKLFLEVLEAGIGLAWCGRPILSQKAWLGVGGGAGDPPLSPAQAASGIPGLVVPHSTLHLHLYTAILSLRSTLFSLINTLLMGFRTKSKPMMLFILKPSIIPAKTLFCDGIHKY